MATQEAAKKKQEEKSEMEDKSDKILHAVDDVANEIKAMGKRMAQQDETIAKLEAKLEGMAIELQKMKGENTGTDNPTNDEETETEDEEGPKVYSLRSGLRRFWNWLKPDLRDFEVAFATAVGVILSLRWSTALAGLVLV